MKTYKFARYLLRQLFRFLYRIEAHGTQHVPKEGAVIICSNHISNWDPPVVGTQLDRIVRFMAKEELFKLKPLGWLFRALGAFPVKRGGVSKESIKYAIQLLRSGEMLCIFPEGTRGGGMGKKGAASLAVRSGATVIPTAVVGSYKPFRKLNIYFGEPVDMSAFSGDTSDSLEQATEEIMRRIRELANRGTASN
ncbi:lysophospholipid acyltransferase family protein [Paenibacillus turpanensis]|uniref:lysophospholipid acyltransferase family protein n=1 Tax=Paenibacillus turpanensis TaxID=2689078 RepID=UPI00140D7F66|nr:lysophospholipid acyltransferase family protein [Paenibacillus turpanensis]